MKIKVERKTEKSHCCISIIAITKISLQPGNLYLYDIIFIIIDKFRKYIEQNKVTIVIYVAILS